MIYLDNIIFSLQKHGGVSVLWGKLIEYLIKNRINLRCLEFYGAQNNEVRKRIIIPPSNLIENKNLPKIIERYRDPCVRENYPSIFHSSHYRICMNKNVANITTVHDFTYEYFYSGLQKKIHTWQKYRAINNSKVIICISENTKKDLLKFFPEIDKKKIRVVYNGVSDEYSPLGSGIYEKYRNHLLFVGGRQSYKNFQYALSAANEVGKKLLIVGSPLNSYETRIANSELGPSNYDIVVNPSNKELNIIYNSVYCLFYPSLYEGFGIPVIEAQRAGCPVIAMNGSSITEIFGSSDLLLNSTSIKEFKRKLDDLNKNRNEIIQQGIDNSQRFSWEKMSESYLNIYNEVIE